MFLPGAASQNSALARMQMTAILAFMAARRCRLVAAVGRVPVNCANRGRRRL